MIMINRVTEYLPGFGRQRAKNRSAAGAGESAIGHYVDSMGNWVGRNPAASLAAAFAAGAVIAWLIKRR